MMKRGMWFLTGIVTGAGSVVLIGRRVRRRMAQMAPVRVAERALDRSRSQFVRIKAAFGEGRQAMIDREDELRQRYEPTSDRSQRERTKESVRSVR